MKVRIKKKIDEAAQGFKDVKELKEYRIKIEPEGRDYFILFFRGKEQTAHFQLDAKNISCGYYMTHSGIYDQQIGKTDAKYGPFGYDLLIELGTLLGGYVASSGSPSGWFNNAKKGGSAINVWKYYNEKRSDLIKKNIADCDKDRDRKSTLQVLNSPNFAKTGKVPENIRIYNVSAITKMYQKKPIFLQKLKEAGMLKAPDEIMSMIPGEEKKGFYDKMKDYFSKFF